MYCIGFYYTVFYTYSCILLLLACCKYVNKPSIQFSSGSMKKIQFLTNISFYLGFGSHHGCCQSSATIASCWRHWSPPPPPSFTALNWYCLRWGVRTTASLECIYCVTVPLIQHARHCALYKLLWMNEWTVSCHVELTEDNFSAMVRNISISFSILLDTL